MDRVLFIPDNPGLLNKWSAVLASRGIEFEIERFSDGVGIWIPEDLREIAIEELWSYHCGNSGWPPRLADLRRRAKNTITSGAMVCGFACAAILVMFYIRQFMSDDSWKELGLWNAELVMKGQWWRCLTALTLHADISHLLSNVFWIWMLVALLTVDIGGGLAALMAVATGALGNLCMLFSGAEHSSLGASTMVFSLVGLLCSMRFIKSFRFRVRHGGNFLRLLPWMPLFTGLVIFAFYGMGGGTDVLAHCMGFLVGLLAGIPALFMSRLKHSCTYQLFFATVSFAVLAFAWCSAA